MRPFLNFIIGCTGCGKGSLARELALRTGGEIVSADSMKVYRRMDVGTAKPSLELRRRIPHHLIDVAEPSEDFSVAEYVRVAEEAICDIDRRGRTIFVVGGTPLYIKALSEGLFQGPGADAELRARLQAEAVRCGVRPLYERLKAVDRVAANRIHPNDVRRIVRALEVYELTGQPISDLQTQWAVQNPRYPCRFLGLRRERDDQARRTNERVRQMMEGGLVEEVRALLAESRPLSPSAKQALGYAETIRYLEGEVSLAEAVEMIKINTRRLAKAQRTWFRRFAGTEWIDLQPDSTAEQVADELGERRGFEWSA